MRVCAPQPPRFEFYDQESPIYTSPRFLPPAKVVKSKINDAIISHGSYLEECTVSNAIVGLRSRIDKGAVIQVPHMSALCRSRPVTGIWLAVIFAVLPKPG